MNQLSIIPLSSLSLPTTDSYTPSINLSGQLCEQGNIPAKSNVFLKDERINCFKSSLDLHCTESLTIPYNPLMPLLANTKKSHDHDHCCSVIQEEETGLRQSFSFNVQHTQDESPTQHKNTA